ncbi:MAG: hypothetical protein HYR62_07135 [Actinobacteria bacterium]|nr:hypothetical protein [Actinomycetota bacterium]MBI3685952.1 hypothetical protein [Actinomycetota bacterium]
MDGNEGAGLGSVAAADGVVAHQDGSAGGLGGELGIAIGDGEAITVELGGHEVRVSATLDLDRDGRDETGFVTDPRGLRLAVSDVDHDGTADRAALLDDAGRVIDTVHWDEAAGRWVEDPAVGDLLPGLGTVLGGDPQPAGGSWSSVPMTGADGRGGTATLAERSDGTTVAFTDSDADGRADRATVFDPTGAVLGTARYDSATGIWAEDDVH